MPVKRFDISAGIGPDPVGVFVCFELLTCKNVSSVNTASDECERQNNS